MPKWVLLEEETATPAVGPCPTPPQPPSHRARPRLSSVHHMLGQQPQPPNGTGLLNTHTHTQEVGRTAAGPSQVWPGAPSSTHRR